MTAPLDGYTVASGLPIYGGRAAPVTTPAPAPAGTFDSIALVSSGSGTPWEAQIGAPLVVELHGSSGSNSSTGQQYRAQVSGNMAFDTFTEFGFSVIADYRQVNGGFVYHVNLRPIDRWFVGGVQRESMHEGFLQPDGRVYLTSEHRYDAMMAWAKTNLTQYNLNQRVLTGGSMGAWGTISYGVPRYSQFAALYADRPRWRYGDTPNQVAVARLDAGWTNYPAASTPLLADSDGGTSYGAHVDMIAYISNPANKVRPIFWCIGRQDGFSLFSEQIAAVNALRATGRAFAFYWNNGDHSTGSQMDQILQSYPYGTYQLDKGWPLFTEHSLDQDPNVDQVGGINIGLSFRNVVETVGGWSCEVTNLVAGCTVKVKPVSEVFTASVAAQNVTIPAAGNWVPVSFSA